jgi:hypothetical protein
MNNFETLALAASVTMSLILVCSRFASFRLSLGQTVKMALIWVGLFVLAAMGAAAWQSWQ